MKTKPARIQANLSEFQRKLLSVSVCLISTIGILVSFESAVSNGRRITVMTDKLDYRRVEVISIL